MRTRIVDFHEPVAIRIVDCYFIEFLGYFGCANSGFHLLPSLFLTQRQSCLNVEIEFPGPYARPSSRVSLTQVTGLESTGSSFMRR